MGNKFKQYLHINDFDHVSDDVFIYKVFDSFRFLLVILRIERHLLIEQIQKFPLNFGKEINVLLHKFFWFWLMNVQNLTTKFGNEVQVQWIFASFKTADL